MPPTTSPNRHTSMDRDIDVAVDRLAQAPATPRSTLESAVSSSRAAMNVMNSAYSRINPQGLSRQAVTEEDFGSAYYDAPRMVSGSGTAQEMINRIENQRRDDIERTSRPPINIQWNSEGPWEPWDGAMNPRPRPSAGGIGGTAFSNSSAEPRRRIRRMCQICGAIVDEGERHSHNSSETREAYENHRLTAQEVRLNEQNRHVNEYMQEYVTVPDVDFFAYTTFEKSLKKEIVEQLVEGPVGTAWKKPKTY